MTVSITRRLDFCAGHRVLGHEGKCAFAHGHNYIVMVEATAPSLDGIGRVVDFSVVKQKCGAWLDEYWDHGFLVYEQDHELAAIMRSIRGQKSCKVPFNPTAENIAAYLVRVFGALLHSHGCTVASVTVHETPNCYAKVSQ